MLLSGGSKKIIVVGDITREIHPLGINRSKKFQFHHRSKRKSPGCVRGLFLEATSSVHSSIATTFFFFFIPIIIVIIIKSPRSKSRKPMWEGGLVSISPLLLSPTPVTSERGWGGVEFVFSMPMMLLLLDFYNFACQVDVGICCRSCNRMCPTQSTSSSRIKAEVTTLPRIRHLTIVGHRERC